MTKIARIITGVEKSLLGNTWAIKTMPLYARVRFARDIGEWPGIVGKKATEMRVQAIINAELEDEKLYCAQRKFKRAQEASLNVTLIIKK